MSDLKGSELNVLMRDKISFVGVDARRHIVFVGRCIAPSLPLAFTIVGSLKNSIGQTNKKLKNCKNMEKQNIDKQAGNKKSNRSSKVWTQRRRRETNNRQSSEKNMETQRSKSVLKISPQSNVGGERQKEHEQS